MTFWDSWLYDAKNFNTNEKQYFGNNKEVAEYYDGSSFYIYSANKQITLSGGLKTFNNYGTSSLTFNTSGLATTGWASYWSNSIGTQYHDVFSWGIASPMNYSLLITTYNNRGQDWSISSSNPRIYVTSGTSYLTSLMEKMYISHDGTNGIIHSDTGSIKITSSLKLAQQTITADYTATDDDYYLDINTSTLAITITLPTAVGHAGLTYIITDANSNASTNNITISHDSTTDIIVVDDGSITYHSNGTKWLKN